MNEQLFGVPMSTREVVERTDLGADKPLENENSYSDHAPQDATLVEERPLSVVAGTHVDTMNPVSNTMKPANPTAVGPEALFSHAESDQFRTRWNEIQAKFVDEPNDAVKQADGLVSEVIQQMAQSFAKQRGTLEGQWNKGDDVSTEDLRMILQRYRTFFNRLLV